jgi:hypothetical protein
VAKFLLLREGRAAQPSASDEQTQAYNRKWADWIRSLAQAGTLESGLPLTPTATEVRPCHRRADRRACCVLRS